MRQHQIGTKDLKRQNDCCENEAFPSCGKQEHQNNCKRRAHDGTDNGDKVRQKHQKHHHGTQTHTQERANEEGDDREEERYDQTVERERTKVRVKALEEHHEARRTLLGNEGDDKLTNDARKHAAGR